MKTSRRRTLVTSMRVALASGAAAVGWLVVGATGAHAAEDLPTMPDSGAPSAVTRTVAGSTADEVLGAAQRTASAAASSGLTTAELLAAPSTVEPVTAPVERPVDVLPVQPLTGFVEEPVESVRSVLEPVTGVVGDILPVTVPAPTVPAIPVIGESGLPAAPVAEEILPGEPARAVENAVSPDPVPAVLPGPDVTAPPAAAPRAESPETERQIARAGASAVASQGVEVTARTARPSSTDFLAGLEPLLAVARTSSASLAATPFSTPAESSPAGGAVSPGTGATTSAAGSGGTGTPLRGAGPDSWPDVPAGHPCPELFPQLHAAQSKVFFGGIEQPPAPPAFDPGSTPD